MCQTANKILNQNQTLTLPKILVLNVPGSQQNYRAIVLKNSFNY